MPKISELIEKLLLKAGNHVAVVDTDDPEALVTKRASIESIAAAEKVLGEIYIYQGVAEQTGITTTPVKLTLFATAQGFNGAAVNISPDKDNNQIVSDKAGAHKVLLLLLAIGTSNTKFTFEIYVNGSPSQRDVGHITGSATDFMSISVSAAPELAIGDVIEIYVFSDDAGGADLTAISAQFIISR